MRCFWGLIRLLFKRVKVSSSFLLPTKDVEPAVDVEVR